MSEKGTSTTTTDSIVFKQRVTQNNDMALYKLESVNHVEWKLFKWLASLKNVENFIYLFIVIWNSVSLNNPQLLQEFIDDTDNMVEFVKDLVILKALNTTQRNNYNYNLIEYKKSRCDDKRELSTRLANNAWAELEDNKLEYSYAFEEQLQRLAPTQKKYLRQTIKSRMISFKLTAIKIQKAWNKEVGILQEQIKTLKAENSRQQAALGNVINVSWDDDDSNSTSRLISDIEELQDMLTDFTMVQGSDFEVNKDSATNLLKTYNCQTKYPSTDGNLVLGAVLQRCTIAIILNEVQYHIQNAHSDDIDPLESDIVNATESLIRYTELFRENRKGSDDITKVTPIKLRQHVYSALGCRGFSNDEDLLIKRTTNKLLYEMNQFRQITDQETSVEFNDLAFKITREVINIFCFRLKTQAVELQHKFFQDGQAIDVRFMQGSFGRDEVKKLEVEICGFPCIGVFDGDQKVFTKAQVIARKKRKNNGDSIVNSMKNMVIGNK